MPYEICAQGYICISWRHEGAKHNYTQTYFGIFADFLCANYVVINYCETVRSGIDGNRKL